MNLQNHLRLKAFRGQAAIKFDHGELNEIGGGALHGRVHGCALGEIAHIGLGRIDFGDLANAAEESACDAGLTRFGDLTIEELFDAAVALEISGNELRGLFLVNAELLGQAEGRKTVNHAEIDDFCDAAMLTRLSEWRDVENFLRGA